MGNKLLNGHEVAKWFIFNNHQLANGYIDGNIKLNKLLYFANLMFYCINRELLIEDDFVAFPKGPVIFSIYKDYRYNGLDEIPADDFVNGINKEQEQILNIINFLYGNKDVNELVEISHSHNIWNEKKDLIPQNPIIEFDKISQEFIDYYNNLYNIYKDMDFSKIRMEKINGNIFYYDINNLEMNDKVVEQLLLYDKFDEPQFIEDVNGELVFS